MKNSSSATINPALVEAPESSPSAWSSAFPRSPRFSPEYQHASLPCSSLEFARKLYFTLLQILLLLHAASSWPSCHLITIFSWLLISFLLTAFKLSNSHDRFFLPLIWNSFNVPPQGLRPKISEIVWDCHCFLENSPVTTIIYKRKVQPPYVQNRALCGLASAYLSHLSAQVCRLLLLLHSTLWTE